MGSRPYAVFSCDLDTVDRHLQGYVASDGIDPRMDRLPGMKVPLEEGLAA
jgi:hypothetical protein